MKTIVTEYRDRLGDHRLRVTAKENGQILLPLEGYKNKSDLIKAALRSAYAIIAKYE